MATNKHIEEAAHSVTFTLENIDEWQSGNLIDNNDTYARGSQQNARVFSNASAASVFVGAAYKWIDPSSGVESRLDVEFKSIYSAESIYVAEYLIHLDDTDTYLAFTADKISIEVGGVTFVDLLEQAGQDYVQWNTTQADIDQRWDTSGLAYAMFLRGSDGVLSLQNSAAPAWKTATYVPIQLGTASGIWGAVSSPELSLGVNTYYDVTDSRDEYIQAGRAGKYQIDYFGQHYFIVNSNVEGAANGEITWHTALFIGTTGDAYFADKLGIGSTSASTAMLEIFQNASPGTYNWFELNVPDAVAHGMTDIMQTESILAMDLISADYGGCAIIGASDFDNEALILEGIRGGTCAGQNDAALVLRGSLKSGTTRGDMVATDVVLEVWNNATVLATMLGDGKSTFTGEVLANGNSKVEASSTTAQSMASGAYTDVKFEIIDVDSLGEITEPGGTYTLFTAGKAGTYAVAWRVNSASAAWDAGEYWFSTLSRNDATTEGNYWRGHNDIADAANTRQMSSNGAAIVTLAATDNLRIKVNQTQGAAVNTGGLEADLFFHIARIA